MPCGNKLVLPKLREGQEMNGFMIHKVFRSKSMYIRPTRSLPVQVSHLKTVMKSSVSAVFLYLPCTLLFLVYELALFCAPFSFFPFFLSVTLQIQMTVVWR